MLLDLRSGEGEEESTLQYDSDEEMDVDEMRNEMLLNKVTDRAHWRAFDACIGLVCLNQRHHAKQCQRQYLSERQEARNRARAFKNLTMTVPENNSSIMTESRPGAQELPPEVVNADKNEPTPDYYLRYLPPNDMHCLQDLCSILRTSYPPSLQVYSRVSLREYTALLQTRYDKEADNFFDEGPALGFC